MNLTHILILYAVVHALICTAVYLCVRRRVLKFSEQLMPIIVLVPFAGLGTAVIADYYSRRHLSGTRPMTVEELHLDDDDLRLRKLTPDEGENAVIPLEEAMSVNDAKTRRALMLEILHRNPEQYAELLHNACMDEDIEVSHYASTAVMELQRGYEYALQKAEREFRENPDSSEVQDRYIKSLGSYISSGLIDKNVLFVYRSRYADVLKKKIGDQPEDMDAVLQAADNYTELGRYTDAAELADLAVAKWPAREEPWLVKIEVCERTNDGDGIKRVIAQIKKRNVYLTNRGRSIIAFWDRTE